MTLSTPFTTRPIDTWPGPYTTDRRWSPFSAKWSQTMRLLHSELGHLDATNIVLQMALREGDIRLDGQPRANARPSHPGVILAFDTPDGPLKFAVDRFHDWQDNMRAIALGLEALRKVERYGITRRQEQYAGWRALPQTAGEHATMDVDQACEVITRHGGTDPLMANRIRNALRAAHPDTGGSDAAFREVTAARAVLEGRP